MALLSSVVAVLARSRRRGIGRLAPCLGIGLAALILAKPAQAQDAAIDVLAGPCANCHGPMGRSAGAIPSIAGLPQAEAAARMLAFRDDADLAATVMPRLMKGYDEAQIRALARWFEEIGR